MGNQVESKAEIVLSSLPCLTSSPLCWDILCDPISLSPFMNFFVYILHCFPHIKFSCDFSPPPQTVVLFGCLYVSFLTGPSPGYCLASYPTSYYIPTKPSFSHTLLKNAVEVFGRPTLGLPHFALGIS